MKMSHFVVRDAILPMLRATTKEGVVRELVESLQAVGQLSAHESEDVISAILRREVLGTTGIGRGIAIPHTRHKAVSQLVGTIGLSRSGIPFESVDNEPVYVFVMLVSPEDRPGDHLRALENVVQTLKDDKFVEALRNCQSVTDIWDLINGTRNAW